jgi:Nucleoside-diphosphate-sugar epimerases
MMRVFVAGAGGAIGSRLVPRLIERGHQVFGTYRSSPERAEQLRNQGAQAVALDLLDTAAVRRAVLEVKPDAIIHEATALSGGFARKLDTTFAQTNLLRTVGTDALLAAAADAGVTRIVAQSFAPYRYARVGGMIKTEEDPLEAAPPAGTEQTFAAMTHVDEAVTVAGGVSLRYGGFYGDADNAQLTAIRKRQFPIVGNGDGVMSWIHLEDAAAATVLALEQGARGIYNIVDDDPAPLRDWLPVLAEALGAKPPRRFPVWLTRLVAGEAAVTMSTQSRGSSNAKAKRELGLKLRYPSWRQGFPASFAVGAAR